MRRINCGCRKGATCEECLKKMGQLRLPGTHLLGLKAIQNPKKETHLNV